MRNYLLLLFNLIWIFAFGQLETANWYFGQNIGMRFENDQILPLANGRLFTGEGCATMSDANGNLLFYTDGTIVYNKLHQVMLNGNALFGNSSSTQSAIVIPFPENSTKYVIFTVSADDNATIEYTTNKGFNFYYVDMTLDGGLGGIVFPENNKLLNISSEKISAVKHINRKDYWVVTHFEDKFYSYLVNNTGVVRTPVISQIGPSIDTRTYPVNSRGYLKISPNGRKLAVAHLSNLNYDDIPFGNLPTLTDRYFPTNGPFANSYPGYLGLYDFNKGNGRVTNEIVLDESGSPYGVEFSPNSKILYSNSDYHIIDENNSAYWVKGELNQYDLTVNNAQIPRTKRVIHTYLNQDTSSAIFTARGALQMALNQRIYISRDQKTYVSHLKDPNNLLNPQFEEVGYRFPYASWSVITRYGLPPFISSAFEKDIELIGIEGLVVCYNQEVRFRFLNVDNVTPISYRWDFGDGSPNSTAASPSHLYSNSGTYAVKLYVQTEEFGELIYEIQITVLPQLEIRNAELSACDEDRDGRVLFNLQDANNLITNLTNVSFKYFRILEDAEANRNEISSSFLSSTNGELVYVRVEQEVGCYAIASITLNHFIGQQHVLDDFVICVGDAGKTIILQEYNEVIENYLQNNSIQNITFYSSQADLNDERNPITSFHLFNEAIKIYAKIKYFEAICDDIVELNFKPSIVPLYNLDNLIKCKDEPIVVQVPEGYIYEWRGLNSVDLNQNLHTNTITIKNPGNYAVLLTNEYGCERLIEFLISDYPPIQVVDVFVENNEQIIINAIGVQLQYSLDGINWQYENVFVNLKSGSYTVYIKNEYGCVVTVNEVFIFRWTNFLSPNSDAYNDQWVVTGLDRYENVKVKIFDRFGKILIDKYLTNEKVIWDGKYNGKLQPSDSYWYIIEIPNHTKYTGFVLLKNKL